MYALFPDVNYLRSRLIFPLAITNFNFYRRMLFLFDTFLLITFQNCYNDSLNVNVLVVTDFNNKFQLIKNDEYELNQKKIFQKHLSS